MTKQHYCIDIDDVDAWTLYYTNQCSTDFSVIDETNTIWFPVFMIDQYGNPSDLLGWNNTPMMKPLLETLFQ